MRGLPPGTIMSMTDPAATGEEDESSFVLAPSLTYGQRAAGAFICFLGAYLLFGSTFRFARLLAGGDPAPFAFRWTVGSVMYLCGMCFLLGPKYCLGSMFRETHLAWYLSSAALTLACSFSSSGDDRSCRGIGGRRVVFVVLGLCQVLSAAWVALSYVPYWRGAIRKLVYIGRLYDNLYSYEEF